MEANRGVYDVLTKAGYLKHVDDNFKNGLLNVIRTEFNPGYMVNLWCGQCVADMVKFGWTQYDKQRTAVSG